MSHTSHTTSSITSITSKLSRLALGLAVAGGVIATGAQLNHPGTGSGIFLQANNQVNLPAGKLVAATYRQPGDLVFF